VATTLWPRASACSAKAWPKPEAAPVMNQVWRVCEEVMAMLDMMLAP